MYPLVVVKVIKFIDKPIVLPILPSGDSKEAISATNTTVQWSMPIGRSEIKELGTSFGSNYTVQTNVCGRYFIWYPCW